MGTSTSNKNKSAMMKVDLPNYLRPTQDRSRPFDTTIFRATTTADVPGRIDAKKNTKTNGRRARTLPCCTQLVSLHLVSLGLAGYSNGPHCRKDNPSRT